MESIIFYFIKCGIFAQLLLIEPLIFNKISLILLFKFIITARL